MINFFKRLVGKKEVVQLEDPEEKTASGFFTTHDSHLVSPRNVQKLQDAFNTAFQKKPPVATSGGTMDSALNGASIGGFNATPMPPAQIAWYASQSFIGYQLCAMISQQWLVSKACAQAAEDAARNGYEVTVNNGTEVDSQVIDAIRKADVDYEINKNLIEFVQMGRVFGIRIALFVVDSDDPEYYKKPFNIDGITPGSYRGISQIDPYWVTPQFDAEAVGNPASINFYEPTWWNINGKLHHRSHLVIFRTRQVADILKPTYLYGGVPLPQQIYERVYAAERTANEAPMLAVTKRTDVINVDTTQALANQAAFDTKMQLWAAIRDNYGVKVLGTDETMNQFDTSLADLDAVIMSQYQLVASIAETPAVKLLGTSPKGFNATGEYDESSYHQHLESIQKNDLTRLVNRHHSILIKSEIAPMFDIEPFAASVVWCPLDTMTAEEEATVNKTKADTGQVLISSGAIDGNDERQRIINDPKSGYSGLEEEVPLDAETEENTEELDA